MGVPGLFGYCLKKFGNKIVVKKLDSKIHYLFIDGNGFIYRAVDLVIKENEKLEFTPNQFYNLIYEKTLSLLDETLEEVKPEILYLTFDGVAPLAKINQQRSRRYKTKYEDDFKSYLDEKYNKPKRPFESIWSNVLITPGTDFMNGLDNFFENKFKEKNIDSKITYIYNGSNICGEGEHKILNFIRGNKEIQDKNIVIHGLDGDLIFLLMLVDIKEKKNNEIFILREINTKCSTVVKSYLNVNFLKDLFIKEICEIIQVLLFL